MVPGPSKYGLFLVLLSIFPFLPADRAPQEQHRDVATSDTLVTFISDIAPLLKTNCSPCHFQGGQVFEKYPFGDYSTVYRLRKRLDTRLQEPEQKALLDHWIEDGAKEK